MKITLGQFNPQLGEKQKNLQMMTQIMERAADERSDLVLFPELCLSGYFIQDISEQLAEPIDGDSIHYMQHLCRSLNLYCLFPWAELAEDGTVYNSACLISNEGRIIGNYRKVHLYDTEKEVFTPGHEFHVFETELGRIGVMICFDLDFPESARILNLQEADIILIPTNNMKPYEVYQETYMRSRAMENELPVVICNRVGQERDYKYFGESAAYDSYGKQLIKMDGENSVRTVEIPLNQEQDKNLQYKENRMGSAYQELLR